MRLLILSYHYPPLNVTASQRAAAWVKYLSTLGHDVSLVTFDWPGISKEPEGAQVYRLPLPTVPDHNHLPLPWRIPLVRTVATLWAYLIGAIDYHTRPHERVMRNFLKTHLQANHYDLVLGIFSPHFHLRHAAQLQKAFQVPFVIDFRDLFNNRYAALDDAAVHMRRGILDRITLWHWKRWMKHAAGFITVSKPLHDVLASWFNKPGITILNGFEPAAMPPPQTDSARFTVLHSGTLYGTQDLTLFMRAYQQFAAGKSNCDLVFSGVTEPMKSLIQKAADATGVTYLSYPREAREDALQRLMRASVLFFPGHTALRGMYSSKIFEYLASGKPIILAPSDSDVLEALLLHQPGCSVHQSEASITAQLEAYYSAYQRSEPLYFSRELSNYTREAQAKELSNWLNARLHSITHAKVPR